VPGRYALDEASADGSSGGPGLLVEALIG